MSNRPAIGYVVREGWAEDGGAVQFRLPAHLREDAYRLAKEHGGRVVRLVAKSKPAQPAPPAADVIERCAEAAYRAQLGNQYDYWPGVTYDTRERWLAAAKAVLEAAGIDEQTRDETSVELLRERDAAREALTMTGQYMDRPCCACGGSGVCDYTEDSESFQCATCHGAGTVSAWVDDDDSGPDETVVE